MLLKAKEPSCVEQLGTGFANIRLCKFIQYRIHRRAGSGYKSHPYATWNKKKRLSSLAESRCARKTAKSSRNTWNPLRPTVWYAFSVASRQSEGYSGQSYFLGQWRDVCTTSVTVSSFFLETLPPQPFSW